VRVLHRAIWRLLCLIGRTFGDVRPRRLLDIIGRRAFTTPEWAWRRGKWGDELRLSPSLHIDRNILALGTYDRDLHMALERWVRPGWICVDVGAHLGEMALHMARLTGPDGQVHAFEPMRAPRARVHENVQRNRREAIVRIHDAALSDHIGEAALHCPPPGADNQGTASLYEPPPGDATIERIPVTTLDAFAESASLERLDLIKVDIQGGEPAFLAGGAKTLRRFQPILFLEVSPNDLSAAGSSPRALVAALGDLGYSARVLHRGRAEEQLSPDRMPVRFSAPNIVAIPTP